MTINFKGSHYPKDVILYGDFSMCATPFPIVIWKK